MFVLLICFEWRIIIVQPSLIKLIAPPVVVIVIVTVTPFHSGSISQSHHSHFKCFPWKCIKTFTSTIINKWMTIDLLIRSKTTAAMTNEGTWKICRWADLRVGDVVQVSNDEYFPADLVILSSRWLYSSFHPLRENDIVGRQRIDLHVSSGDCVPACDCKKQRSFASQLSLPGSAPRKRCYINGWEGIIIKIPSS